MLAIKFDTHGITEECPMSLWMTSADCLGQEQLNIPKCVFCKGSEGFTVSCSYNEEVEGHKEEVYAQV